MAKSFIKSVSISEEMDTFLFEHPEISLSKIVQLKLLEIMEFQTPSLHEIVSLKSANIQLRDRLQKAGDFIDKKGLWAEFCK